MAPVSVAVIVAPGAIGLGKVAVGVSEAGGIGGVSLGKLAVTATAGDSAGLTP